MVISTEVDKLVEARLDGMKEGLEQAKSKVGCVLLANTIKILQMEKASSTILSGEQFEDNRKRLSKFIAVLGFQNSGLRGAVDIINHLLEPNYIPLELSIDFQDSLDMNIESPTEAQTRDLINQPMNCRAVRMEVLKASMELGAPIGVPDFKEVKNG